MTQLSFSEVETLRAETPGCANVLHFNHAGSSLMPQSVIEATIGHQQLEAEIGGYEAADIAGDRLEAAYDSIAALIGANRYEIAVIENATRAWDMAVYGIPLKAGDRILTSVSEYGSNVIAFLQIAQRGVSIEVVPNDEHGQLSVTELANLLDDRVKVIAVSHMPTNGGLVQPAAEIGRLARDAGAIYVLDACQTVGQMPVDVDALNVDILSATSRKYLRGPRGVGFLYVREALIEDLMPPFLDNRAATWTAIDAYEVRKDARRFENWESFVAGKLGLGAAVDYALQIGLDRIWETLHAQAEQLRVRLSAIPGVTVRDLGETRGGIVTFTHDGIAADELQSRLAAHKINTTASSVFSTRYDMEARGLAKVNRASVHYLTTDAEIDALIEVVAAV